MLLDKFDKASTLIAILFSFLFFSFLFVGLVPQNSNVKPSNHQHLNESACFICLIFVRVKKDLLKLL